MVSSSETTPSGQDCPETMVSIHLFMYAFRKQFPNNHSVQGARDTVVSLPDKSLPSQDLYLYYIVGGMDNYKKI